MKKIRPATMPIGATKIADVPDNTKGFVGYISDKLARFAFQVSEGKTQRNVVDGCSDKAFEGELTDVEFSPDGLGYFYERVGNHRGSGVILNGHPRFENQVCFFRFHNSAIHK